MEQQGVRAWLKEQADPSVLAAWEERHSRARIFLEMLDDARRTLEALYLTDEQPAVLRQRKQAVFERLQARYRVLREEWGGYSGYDAWMARPLNNARLASQRTYARWVPALDRLWQEEAGDWERVHVRMEQLANLSGEQRRQVLMDLESMQLAGQ